MHGVSTYKAVELERAGRAPTGRTLELVASTRQEAIALLLKLLEVGPDDVQVDPSRTIVVVNGQPWTLVKRAVRGGVDPPGLRRAGAKHRRVR
jgi:hypothetical protein